MAVCPKCGHRLKLTDWKPDCPECGVNMVYYNSNERLLEESENTEIAHAKFQPGVDRAKASTIGSLPAIMRIVLEVLPLFAIALPLVSLNGENGKTVVSCIKLYNYINEIGFGNIFSNAFSGNTICLAIALLLAATILIPFAGLFLMKSLGPKGGIINLTFDTVKLLLSIGSAVCFELSDIPSVLSDKGYSSGNLYIGAYIIVLLYLAVLVYSRILHIKGLPIKHSECLIGGLPADEYFEMVEQGVDELEIRKKMVEVLTVMQEEYRKADAEAREKEEAERAARRNGGK